METDPEAQKTAVGMYNIHFDVKRMAENHGSTHHMETDPEAQKTAVGMYNIHFDVKRMSLRCALFESASCMLLVCTNTF
jgi:hypothetical protein